MKGNHLQAIYFFIRLLKNGTPRQKLIKEMVAYLIKYSAKRNDKMVLIESNGVHEAGHVFKISRINKNNVFYTYGSIEVPNEWYWVEPYEVEQQNEKETELDFIINDLIHFPHLREQTGEAHFKTTSEIREDLNLAFYTAVEIGKTLTKLCKYKTKRDGLTNYLIRYKS